MKMILGLALLVSMSPVWAQQKAQAPKESPAQARKEQQQEENKDQRGPITVVVVLEKGKTTDDKDVHAASAGAETTFKANTLPVTVGARLNVLSNPGFTEDYKVVEAEGYIRYPFVSSGPNNNARLIFDLAYAMGYDKQIGFKGTLGVGLTLAVCSNNREGEIPEWRLCWINNAKTGMMMEKAVYVEASTALELQKKISDAVRLRGGVRAVASGLQDEEKNLGIGAASINGVLGVDFDVVPAKKSESKSK